MSVLKFKDLKQYGLWSPGEVAEEDLLVNLLEGMDKELGAGTYDIVKSPFKSDQYTYVSYIDDNGEPVEFSAIKRWYKLKETDGKEESSPESKEA